ncbi:16S rRNA (uracil(1498)-N(3))-methyltransferase [Candidatus Mycoplasma mahonii]|uniref:16S rRNA (uracil(1498)-N(3))-methyltransferase n=1 Tax=Candidatus Mycoplasma mahonii TaxID=3004105 RepID=UPI0026F23FD4|nr:16S rRNA (uracil(1498)-N(3))-methyltransferase [Candidatus Mycoplasma mahonii]WKX02365.1 16S rRNA (uracil(1498)-N(3))-methyltransferase [Candidatus Mycoplasma mahonii]
MFRFFVNEKDDEFFPLTQETLRHIKVARVQNKEFICTYNKTFYVCTLENNHAKIIRQMDDNHEFTNEVILAASIIDSKRFDLLIQKASELGATKFIPMQSVHVSKKISGDLDKKVARWNKIAFNASEQSFRNVPMEVTNILSFDQVIVIDQTNKFIAHVTDASPVKNNLPTDSIFLVGPEGGFSDSEISLAKKNNFQVLNLGKRILRAETASIFILSRIND